jgi:hypothetical protein
MCRRRFRLTTVVLGLLIMVAGTTAIRAQCGTGCNQGAWNGVSFVLSDEACPSGDECEDDECTTPCCLNSYSYCILVKYFGHFIACTPNADCCP